MNELKEKVKILLKAGDIDDAIDLIFKELGVVIDGEKLIKRDKANTIIFNL